MKRLLLGVLTAGAVSGVALMATNAFFNDTEKSTGNSFTAGSIDLKVSNHSFASNSEGVLVASQSTTWESTDLDTSHKFFNFTDLKPGDIGEDTIDLRVDNNPSWACAKITLTTDKDNSCTDPEKADDPSCDPNSTANFDGDLAGSVQFVWWKDDGDNVLETDEEATKYYLGPASISSLLGTDHVLDLTLADKQLNFFAPQNPGTPLAGLTTYYIGKGWCFGTMTLTPVAQDEVNTGTPLTRGTGFSCNGSSVNNAAQSDSLTADIEFTVEQYRNNPDFLCPEHQVPAQAPQ